MSDTLQEQTAAAPATPPTLPTQKRMGRPPKSTLPQVLNTPTEARHVPLKMPEIEWIGREESERLDTMIGRDFVRRVEKESGESKKYFWRIMSACPAVPSFSSLNAAGMTNRMPSPNQSLVSFSVQKFYRNKFAQKSDARNPGKSEKVNEAVQWVTIDPVTGNSYPVDPDDHYVNFSMDSKEFERQFKRDSES